MNKNIVFTANYLQYLKGQVAHFPAHAAKLIMDKGVAIELVKEMPQERLSTNKMVSKETKNIIRKGK